MLRSHTTKNHSGVIGTMAAARAVSGWLMVGMKSGASGAMTSAGNTTELGKCLE